MNDMRRSVYSRHAVHRLKELSCVKDELHVPIVLRDAIPLDQDIRVN